MRALISASRAAEWTFPMDLPPALRYWYPLGAGDSGYKTYPLSRCSSCKHTQPSPSLQFPFSLSAAASGVWAWIDEAYFWSHYFSQAHLILSFIKQDLGWRRTLASVDHSFGPHRSAPLHPWYLRATVAHCSLNPKNGETQERQINCIVEIRTPAEPLRLSIIHTRRLLSLHFIDTTFHCWPHSNAGDSLCPCCGR